ncbi:ferrochelatase [Ancylobacter sp. A5.8]|uniref:ferrochelatase n=1 Tax=Ancylobacter gelatini TaxID=2919920 RepID=UPI001F4DD7AA|nr:ferrochelatase [Ancylobacter gelatini]MCJ8144327.1 ferrochelatase [Ancylobacter gelatini]
MNKAVPVPRGADSLNSTLPAGHPPVAYGRIGVLIVNLGTPDGTDYWSMRRYLREFLSDRRVIEVNRVLWWFLLNVVILSRRPQAKGKDYETIWNKERNEGPLRTITRAQSEKLSAALAPLDQRLVFDWAMRYGTPSIASRIEALQKIGCERILLVPLYPQYAAATSATVCDAAFDQLKKMRWQPVLRVAPHWPDEPTYIEALANSITTELAKLDWEPELVLASFHGIPKSYFAKGDPYQCYCHQTTRLVREKLGWPEGKLKLTFQSRFGKEEWLQPYTDKTVEALAKSGVKRLAVITPGFVADCLETLEEIGGENAEIFLHNGGEKFHFIPCLNDSDGGMAVLEAVVKRELRGWVDLD